MSIEARIHSKALKEYNALEAGIRENVKAKIDELGSIFHNSLCLDKLDG